MSRGRRWLHRLALLTAACTGFLVFAGGMVTSTGSGLAVPDWPLSYGTLFPPMVGGIFYEHGHRLVAGAVALLTAGLALFAWRVEPRRWVRRLAFLALVAVLGQAVLGGLTVLFLLPIGISVSHAAVANLFFCGIVGLAVVTRPAWRAKEQPRVSTAIAPLRGLWLAATGAIFLQVLLGALMRHSGAGLAIPDFPLSFGRLVPPLTSWPVTIHFAHRLGAVAVLCLCAWVIAATLRRGRGVPHLVRPALVLGGLLPVQILLGGITIWSQKAPLLTSLHVLAGTVALGVALWTTLEAWRLVDAREAGMSTISARLTVAAARVMDHVELTKPRITLMILFTVLLGYVLGAGGAVGWTLLPTLLGAALITSGTGALNQYLEREVDGRMRRTARRPLPSGRVRPGSALAVSLGLCTAGALTLLIWVNGLTTLLALSTTAIYVLAYTPLKARTSLATLIGAIPGALPPVGGWAAATGRLDPEAAALFAILFLWQIPHFLAIGWLYRDDYAATGLRMLPVPDADGRAAGQQVVVACLALLPASLVPFLLGIGRPVSFAVALALGLTYAAIGVRFALHRSTGRARRLLLVSVIYVPLLGSALLLDSIGG